MEEKRKVVFSDQFESKIKEGIDLLADAVMTTMGPKGKLVLIQKENKHPIVTKDGVTVANSINLIDDIQNMGVKIIKEAASRTADEAGDGTTTSTVLARSIYSEGLKMKSAGYQVNGMKKGIEKGLALIKEELFKNKKNITTKEEINQVALISANGEKDIANMIVSAIEKSGPDGSIIVESAKGFKSELITVDGFKINRGYLSPYFVTDKNKMNAVFSKPLVLICDREFTSIHDLLKPLEMALELGRPTLLICNDISGDAMKGLVLNKTKGALKVCAIKSPGFGASRHEMLVDLQSIVGGTILTSTFDMSTFTQECFGTCEKAIIHKNMSMIISKESDVKKDSIEKRIESIHERLEEKYSLAEGEEDVLRYRLQQLSGGISILRIGAATESELVERYDRVDDALNASKAAILEGILPGGGTALLKVSKKIKDAARNISNQNVRAGMEILSKSIQEPFLQIIRNSNNTAEIVLEKVINSKKDIGYDSREDKYGNMYEMGIVDPHKVVRCAIENAVSAAVMLLCVDCCLIQEKENLD